GGGWGKARHAWGTGLWEKPKINGKDLFHHPGCWVDLQHGTGLSVTPRAAHFRDGQIEFSGPRAPLALLDAVGGFDLPRIGVVAFQTELAEDLVGVRGDEGEEQVRIIVICHEDHVILRVHAHLFGSSVTAVIDGVSYFARLKVYDQYTARLRCGG